MFVRGRTWLVRLFVLLGAAISLTGPAGAEEPPLRLLYRIEYRDFHLMDMLASFEFGADKYRVTLLGATIGVIEQITRWKGRGAAVGTIGPQGLRPARAQSSTRWRLTDRELRLVYLEDGTGAAKVRARVEPPYADESSIPVTQALIDGTIDPLSMAASVIRDVDLNGRCGGRYAIFDGQYRYDLTAEAAGETRLPAVPDALYAGPAIHCRVTFIPVAGFPSNVAGGVPRPTAASVWLGPAVPDGLPVPVRISAQTTLGALDVYLSAVNPPPDAVAAGE